MSAMFNAITQPKFQAELEKNETLIGSHEITKMKEEYKKLKTIEKKYDGLMKKYDEQKKKIKELISGATQVSVYKPDSADTILGVPKDLFEPGQLQVIIQTANKVKTKHNLQIKEEATD